MLCNQPELVRERQRNAKKSSANAARSDAPRDFRRSFHVVRSILRKLVGNRQINRSTIVGGVRQVTNSKADAWCDIGNWHESVVARIQRKPISSPGAVAIHDELCIEDLAQRNSQIVSTLGPTAKLAQRFEPECVLVNFRPRGNVNQTVSMRIGCQHNNRDQQQSLHEQDDTRLVGTILG